jgi:proline racemase
LHWTRILNVVKVHVAGEVGNVVVGGIGDVPGQTMYDKRLYLEAHQDSIRKLLLFEPRGGVTHSVNVVLPSNSWQARLGYVIMGSTEYPAMSGSNTMCVATALLETGIVEMTEPVTELTLESPSGLISLRCDCKDGKVIRVRLVNRPAFAYHLGVPLEVEGTGTLTVDLAYGGMTYVIVNAADIGFSLVPAEGRDLCALGEKLKEAAASQLPAVHPENPGHPTFMQTEFTGELRREDGILASRSAVVISPGRLDRSPCGTGTSARLAVMHARGQIGLKEDFIHQSIIGTRFQARIEDLTTVGEYPAVIPSIAGQGWITELSQVGLDPSDPFPEGYTCPDTWMKVI